MKWPRHEDQSDLVGREKGALRMASRALTFTPVGIAIIIMADVKYARVSTSIPTVKMRKGADYGKDEERKEPPNI